MGGTILVTGATGTVGSEIVKQLSSAANIASLVHGMMKYTCQSCNAKGTMLMASDKH